MNNKKTIITLILVLFIGIIGLTVAYFSNSTTIDNLFSTKEYGSTITETFTSPSNWLPGDTTEKKVVATNTGEVDQAVRISYTEKWLSTNNNELNGWIHEDGTKSNHETELELNTDERVALINFDNNDDWTYNNGYYYYNYRLQPNESTSSLIKSVSFNSKTKLDDTCTTTISEGKKTITCNSSGDNYDGATYTLTFKIETVQYDKYMNAWNTDVAILNEQSLFCDAFEVGEVVEYNNAEYYVLKDSSTSDDYVTLLKKDPLTASEVNQYSTSYVSQDGEYPYYESDTCNENNQTGCSTNYDTSDVKKILDGWSSSFLDDLVSVNGYKTRLIDAEDVILIKEVTPSSIQYMLDYSTPGFIISGNNLKYWTSMKTEDSYSQIIIRINTRNVMYDNMYEKYQIRPVINLKKSVLNGVCSYNNGCNINNYEHISYSIGDIIRYKNVDYYVVDNSNSNQNYVSLLKKDLLTYDEINDHGRYDIENNNGIGTINYNLSNINIILNDWIVDNNIRDNLVKLDGYRIRMLNDSELNNLGHGTGVQYSGEGCTGGCRYVVFSDYEWVYTSIPYWTNGTLPFNKDVSLNEEVHTVDYNVKYALRPVINLKKCAISN